MWFAFLPRCLHQLLLDGSPEFTYFVVKVKGSRLPLVTPSPRFRDRTCKVRGGVHVSAITQVSGAMLAVLCAVSALAQVPIPYGPRSASRMQRKPPLWPSMKRGRGTGRWLWQ